MRSHFGAWMLCLLLLASMSSRSWGQTSGRTFHWLGDAGGDVTNGANWLDLPDPDSGGVPGPQDYLELRWGDRAPVPLEYGAADATYERVLFNHADAGTTINGTGTLTFTQTGGPTDVNVKSIETQGGERLSTINTNVVALGLIEARNGHDIQFNGSTTVSTVHAYVDGAVTSDVIFNGPVSLTGYGEAKFMTGTGTVRFNNEVVLDHQVENSGFGIRNGMTAILGPGFSATRLLPEGGGGVGLDTVDMYNGSGFRLEGDFLVGNDTDLFSRFGDGQDNNNTLDLNGFSDHVEFLGTHPGANFIIDYGDTTGANTFAWETTHHHFGTYEVVNFEIGLDTLTLGNLGGIPWSIDDSETDGDATNGRPDVADKFAATSINGIDYANYDPLKTEPYWTLVDPTISRAVEFFNVPNLPLNADFDGNNVIDGADFLIWQRGLGQTNQMSNANGDADRNGTVEAADLAVWKTSFGGAPAVAAVGAVPEPSTALLVAVGSAGVALGRRRRVAA